MRGNGKVGDTPKQKYILKYPTWAISSFSRRVKSLGSWGPVQVMAVSRMCEITGPCLT